MATTNGIVSASSLNVRPGPSTEKPPVGKLTRGTKVSILEKTDGWYKIISSTISGYVSGDYITIIDPSPVSDFLWEMERLSSAPLTPLSDQIFPILAKHSAAQRMAARTWNDQGGLLGELCKTIDIEPACAVAVLCVESGGTGFDVNNRMIVRFENHIFWNQWGKNNPDNFNVHFRFNSQKKWLGHKFRENSADGWSEFHGNQDYEWKVLDFARGLNESAALNAISMGGPQIMGFNSARLGYDTVQEMFAKFSADIRYQILGLFDFLRGPGTTSAMIEALQRQNYVQFASYYNGLGQASVYGARIESCVKAFESLKV